ncbi:MAG: uracil phosphoribosyltransferase [Elusimicrobiales bacterium]|nr:uracil phosphoribosyltransferase [Elusimicrobiales bacterium]
MSEYVHVSSHPLVKDRLARLRDKNTGAAAFRRIIEEISLLIGYEALARLAVSKGKVTTPIAEAVSERIASSIVFVAVLRTGLAYMEGLLKLYPKAKQGHIGLKRDGKTLNPVKYYESLPPCIADSEVFILDPMIATGGSSSAAVSMVKAKGAKKITFIALIASKQGIQKLLADHPGMHVFLAAIDPALNEKGYIVPGLGDAGDRLFF